MSARPRVQFPEHRGRQVVYARSAGRCEACGGRTADSWSHRVAKGRGGSWGPSNGLHVCGSGVSGCHGWFEAHPTWAGEGGWHIRRDRRSPLDVPAFIVTPEAPLGAWVLLDDEGGREQVHHDDYGLPEVPAHLPPGHVRTMLGRPLSTVPWVEP